MTLEIPDLDDRTYDEILDDARKRIPVYTDEWTDHNAHDPGITILEMLAWLAETYGYQLDRVTDAHRTKYAELLCGRSGPSTPASVTELLGDPPRPPTPASVDLQLDVTSSLIGTELPTGAELSAIRSGGAVTTFETVGPLALTGATIESVVSVFPGGRTDNATANRTAGLSFDPFGPDAALGSAMYLGFDGDPYTNGNDALDLYVDYDDDGLIPPAVHGRETPTFVPSVRIDWQFCIDYDAWRRSGSWISLPVEHDESEQFHAGGRIRLGAPDPADTEREKWADWRTTAGRILGRETPYRWLRGVVTEPRVTDADEDEGGRTTSLPPCEPPSGADPQVPPRHDVPPRIEAMRVNVVTVRHRTVVSADPEDAIVLRRSDGGVETTARQDQTFDFPEGPIIEADVVLRSPSSPTNVDASWEEVPTLDGAGPHDRVYLLERERGRVRFGDGLRGAVPPAGWEVASPRYVVGGGTRGNVPRSAEWRFGAYDFEAVAPLTDATGGTDAETVKAAVARLRRDMRVPYRAVSLADYRYVATHTPGLRVGRAAAVVEKGAAVDGCEDHRRVVVVAVPYNRANRPEPSAGFLEAVECHLKRHALLTDVVTVSPPTYVGVGVRTVVRLEPGTSTSDVERAIEATLDEFLDPLRGYDGNGWPFGRPVYRSELYERIAGVTGVECAVDLSVTADGGEVDSAGDVIIHGTALVYPMRHEVIVRTDRDTCGTGG